MSIVSEKLETAQNWYFLLNESLVGIAFSPINSFLDQLTELYILLFYYFIFVFLKNLLIKLWKNETFLFQPKLIGHNFLLYDILDIICAKTYLFIYFLCGKYINFMESVKLFAFFFIFITLNLSIIKIMLILYTISFIKFRSLIFIQYAVFSKLIGKKLIFKRWGVLRNGFISEYIDMWKHLGKLNLNFKSNGGFHPQQILEQQLNELQMSDENKKIFIDLIKSYKLLVTAASYHENLGNISSNYDLSDSSLRWKTLQNWNETNENSRICALIQKNKELGEGERGEESKEEVLKKKNAILELEPGEVINNLLLSANSAKKHQNLLKTEELELLQKTRVIKSNLVDYLLENKYKDKKDWISQKHKEISARDIRYLEEQKKFEEMSPSNNEFKNIKLNSDSQSMASFFYKRRLISNEYFQRNNFFKFYISKSVLKKYKTEEYYFSEITILYEQTPSTQNLKYDSLLETNNEFKNLLKKCRSEEFIKIKKEITCDIIFGEYDNVEKCSLYTNKKFDFSNFENDETYKFNFHPKIISIKPMKIEGKSVLSFFNLTSNHANKSFLTNSGPFTKKETLGSILSYGGDNLEKYNSTSKILRPQSIISANMEFQQNEFKVQTNSLLYNDSSSISNTIKNQEKFQIVSMEKNYEMRESTWKNFCDISKIKSISNELKKNLAMIHRENNLKKIFATSNIKYSDFAASQIKHMNETNSEESKIWLQLNNDFKKIDILCEAAVWTHLTLKSYFFIKNKEILVNEVCKCSSLDLIRANRVQLYLNQAEFVETGFKRDFENQTQEILKNSCYEGNEPTVKLCINFYAILKVAHAEKFLDQKFDFTGSNISDHGTSNLSLSFFLAKEALNNPLYKSKSGYEDKTFLKIFDAVGPVGL